jgi:hypothetical protein
MYIVDQEQKLLVPQRFSGCIYILTLLYYLAHIIDPLVASSSVPTYSIKSVPNKYRNRPFYISSLVLEYVTKRGTSILCVLYHNFIHQAFDLDLYQTVVTAQMNKFCASF